jgi:eukaryotic-like serine/threonine-protein kinase
VVYLVATRGPGDFSKLLVLKELQAELAEEPAILEMFFEEARLAARLNHPNIVQTYEVGTEGTRHFIVMDYLSGRPLSRVLRRKDAGFTRAMQLRVLCEVLQALDYAHKLTGFDGKAIGIVHRDVNPQNVFITFDGQVKLLDFGIAKALDSHIETRTGVLKGKPGYMAPEQVSGGIDTRADIYAVGTMIWEVVAGRRLWSGKTDIEILAHLMEGKVPSLTEAAPDAPPELVRMAEKAMARKPEDRYATAAELHAELNAYIAAGSEVPMVRDVAAVVTRMFAEDHARTRAAIDKSLAALRAGDIEIVPAPLSANTMNEGTPSGAGRVNEATEPPPSSAQASSNPQGTGVTAATIVTPAAVPPRRRGWLLGAVVGGVVLLALIGLGVLGLREPEPEGSQAGVVAPPVSPPATGDAPREPESPPAQDTPLPAVKAKPTATSNATPASTKVHTSRGSRQPAAPAAPTSTPAPVAAPPPASTCNPPFYFQGTKKVYKPGCI